MRIKPLPPESLNDEARYVHEAIAKLVGHSQSQVTMMDKNGALLGPTALRIGELFGNSRVYT